MVDLKLDIKKKETVKTIEINDEGDIITIDFGDNDFMKKLFNLEKEAEKMQNLDKNNIDFDEMMHGLYSVIENLFGKDINLKIFGRPNPSFIPVFYFIQQIMQFVHEQMNSHFGQNMNRAQRRANARG